MTRTPEQHSPPDLANPNWRVSSFSTNGGGGDCVEVAVGTGSESRPTNKAGEDVVILVRDSKNSEATPLTFTLAEWDAFVAAVKAGEFDSASLVAEAHAAIAN